MSQAVIRFHNSKAFTGLTGVVDHQSATIHGVSLITSDLEAEGHSLFVDKTTLTQLHQLASEMGQLPVTQDHDGGIASVNGFIHNFRMDGNRLRGDWCLLQTHEDTPTMLERAERQPGTFGLSVAFKGDPKGVLHNGKQCARAEKLLSADVVKRPAANPEGLFSAKDVDTLKMGMADETNNQAPTIQDLMASIQQLATQVQQQGEIQQQIVGHINQSVEGGEGEEGGLDRDTLESLYNATDEQLAEHGISRDDVNAAVDQFNAQFGGEGAEGGEGEGAEGDGNFQGSYGEGTGAGGEQGAAAGAGAATGGGTQLAAIQRELVQLKSKMAAKEKQEIQFAEKELTDSVLAKINLITGQRDELREFSEKCVAEIEALNLHLRTGTRPVKPGVENGVRLFAADGNGELHQFQVLVKQIEVEKKCSPGQAIVFAMKEPNGVALHADWLQSTGATTIRA